MPTFLSPGQSAFIASEREHARIRAVGLESYYAAVVAGLSDDDCERAFALACDSERVASAIPTPTATPTPTIRAYIVGENESTKYVCPTCYATRYAGFEGGEGWAVTSEDGLDIPACDNCGAEIDG